MNQAPDLPRETWTLSKPVLAGEKGVVVSQEIEAAETGAAVLRDGGNAIDAAIATAFALTVTEPWMSGLGGGGFLVAYSARERSVRVVDFGMKAPAGLDPAYYRLTGGTEADMFAWPQVRDDANMHGPHAIAVPGAVAGYALALRSFGTRSWQDVIAPAIELAGRGHRVTWWTTLNVAADAALLARYPASRALWLPDGFPAVMPPDPRLSYLPMPALQQTLRTLQAEGPRAFYEGSLARTIAGEIEAAGGTLRARDLADYQARIVDPLSIERGHARYHVPPGLTAGPTFLDALSRLPGLDANTPRSDLYQAHASAMIAAYRHRLATMGHAGDAGERSCTTHISAGDAAGNLVMLTTTLLSRFGSRLTLPESGVLMNNGIYWFDPRPGRPNSLAAGRRPLSNMCPMVATQGDAPWFGFGASGGRRIMPAVFQLASFVNDLGMDLETALAAPRIDVSGVDSLLHDDRIDADAAAALGEIATAGPWPAGAFPALYACPSGVMMREAGRGCIGGAHIASPAAGAAVA